MLGVWDDGCSTVATTLVFVGVWPPESVLGGGHTQKMENEEMPFSQISRSLLR